MTMIAFAFLQFRRLKRARRGKKESTDHRLDQACRPSVTPSWRSSPDRHRSDAHTAENRSARARSVNKSAKVVLGLGKYEAIFRENDIDETVLPSLTHENLKELGVTSFGHRVKLLDAIAALRSDASGKASSVDAATASSAPSATPEDRAERRQVTVM